MTSFFGRIIALLINVKFEPTDASKYYIWGS
ncbi:MAG: hypothetical protein RL213_206 [Bacteroidota bacterium]|jgi:hypothetical protein